MSADLLDQFLTEECTPHVQKLLEERIANTTLLYPHFDFDRFEVTVERATNTVVIQDVTDTTETGTQRVPLDEFMRALSRRSA